MLFFVGNSGTENMSTASHHLVRGFGDSLGSPRSIMKLVQIFAPPSRDSLKMGSAWVWEAFPEARESFLHSFKKHCFANRSNSSPSSTPAGSHQAPTGSSQSGGAKEKAANRWVRNRLCGHREPQPLQLRPASASCSARQGGRPRTRHLGHFLSGNAEQRESWRGEVRDQEGTALYVSLPSFKAALHFRT